MKKIIKPAIFIFLNLLLLLIIAGFIAVHIAVYQGEDALALLIFIIFDPAFAVVGIGLFVLGEFCPISILNKLLPFVAIVAFTVPIFAITNYKTGAVVGISIGIVLSLLTIAVVARSLILQKRK